MPPTLDGKNVGYREWQQLLWRNGILDPIIVEVNIFVKFGIDRQPSILSADKTRARGFCPN